ncbi:acylphosphatase [Penicillium hispanicum]|uniref:acylphosphatase n=1 Tax=Penicillium hispanicum TaxID=1080232 RepID=UPI002540E352|nr:acylphosphatase [Penicillium hispanicum]KAJ5595054.1 acylphosphatase [Penicillium hispanicum]
MSSKRVAFKVHGTVQGVGFRDFTQKCAINYGLKGFVRNTTCGRVEGEAQGDEETLKKLFQQLDKGPRLAHVVKLEKRELEPKEGEDHFAVMRTMESSFNSHT